MPNWSSGLSRSASRWASQVGISIGATLIAALILQWLPHATAEAPPPAPELTSGGKFAARVASARAYDGLDTMPLPPVDASRAASPFVIPAAFLTAPPADLAGIGVALPQPAVDGLPNREHARVARLARIPSRAEARRAPSAADAAQPTAGPHDATPPETAVAEPAGEGLLRQVVSRTRQVWGNTSATTRGAWSATASVGSSLVSRLIPE